MDILNRMLKYLSFNTTSNSNKNISPSTKSQYKFAKYLIKELKKLNLKVHFDEENCYVYALLKGNIELPKIGFISHLDITKDYNKKNIKPNLINNYDGKNIVLNNNIILSPKMFPELNNYIGKTIITADGTTILGADNKAGIIEIMNMLDHFVKTNENHGDIFVCFNPDEEIGIGTNKIDLNYFNPDFAYAVDGKKTGDFSYENFNSANITINIKGSLAHYGDAKKIMINACRIATIINSMIPSEIPENTKNYEGFYHLKEISGNINSAKMVLFN